MFRKIASLVIAALLCNGVTASAQTAQEIKLKRQVVERGINQRVKIKLQSGETLQGNIAEIRNDSFTLQLVDDAGQINNRDIAYSELSKVSKAGEKKAGATFKRGLLMGAGIYLGMVAVAAVVIGVASAASH